MFTTTPPYKSFTELSSSTCGALCFSIDMELVEIVLFLIKNENLSPQQITKKKRNHAPSCAEEVIQQ